MSYASLGVWAVDWKTTKAHLEEVNNRFSSTDDMYTKAVMAHSVTLPQFDAWTALRRRWNAFYLQYASPDDTVIEFSWTADLVYAEIDQYDKERYPYDVTVRAVFHLPAAPPPITPPAPFDLPGTLQSLTYLATAVIGLILVVQVVVPTAKALRYEL